MFPSVTRKRNRDAAEDPHSLHHEKKPRCSAVQEQTNLMSNSSAFLLPHHIPQNASDLLSSGEDNSISSTVSEASSSSDTDMDMDTSSDFQMAFSQSPEQASSSWTLRSSPLRTPRMAVDNRGTRIATPTVVGSIRSHPAPVQVPTASNMHPLSAVPSRSHLGHTVERFPSPISEDEPHTPTTAAGSQLSLLTVTDMDLDMDPPDPPSQPEPVTVRKQRQRSGAFTSPREPPKEVLKKFSMGYRDDCEKCRNRVPGHMNHFLGR